MPLKKKCVAKHPGFNANWEKSGIDVYLVPYSSFTEDQNQDPAPWLVFKLIWTQSLLRHSGSSWFEKRQPYFTVWMSFSHFQHHIILLLIPVLSSKLASFEDIIDMFLLKGVRLSQKKDNSSFLIHWFVRLSSPPSCFIHRHEVLLLNVVIKWQHMYHLLWCHSSYWSKS